MTVSTLLGDYPVTRALRHGEVTSPLVHLDFADVRAPATAFKRLVREMAFDVAELAIVTFLLAKAHGKPLVLLPAVVMGRFQHPFLVHNRERGPLAPGDLPGRRVGIRSYSVTTVTGVRGILADDSGVDLDRITWVTFEEPHVAEFRDPPNVERAAPGKDLVGMLLAGEVDAAIVGDGVALGGAAARRRGDLPHAAREPTPRSSYPSSARSGVEDEVAHGADAVAIPADDMTTSWRRSAAPTPPPEMPGRSVLEAIR